VAPTRVRCLAGLHEAANEARARVSKVYALADEIDRNANLSSDDKYRQRSEIMNEAIANFEASKTLARAREAVALAVAKHVSPESDGMLKALKETERGWQRAMNKIAERAGSDQGSRTRGVSSFSPR
jgi:O6-methylguanine-DNA--protein-cysteine methyltransferase